MHMLVAMAAAVCTGCTHDGTQPRSARSAPTTSPTPTATPTARSSTSIPLPERFFDYRDVPHGPPVLRRLSGMDNVSRPVATPSGYEAATWTSDDTGQMAVWDKRDHSRWQEVGRLAYFPVGVGGWPGCAPDVIGRLLTGSRHATFIAYDCFTGDGAANAEAIGRGPNGWGVLAQTGNRLTPAHPPSPTNPSGTAWDPVIMKDVEFDHGGLLTIGANPFFSNAAATDYARLRLWKWRRGWLSVVADSGFTAAPSTAPDASAPILPAAGCPNDGTYRASFVLKYPRLRPRWEHPNADLDLLVFPPSGAYPAKPTCEQSVSSNLPLTALAAHQRAKPSYERSGPITNRRWITAPAWFMGVGGALPGMPVAFFYVGPLEPYVVPKALGVNEMLSAFGMPPSQDGYPASPDSTGYPAKGTVTFRDGRVVALASH
jgi:hypothetical protein